MSKAKVIRDEDGKEVREGDTIYFSYGIPGVAVHAPIICRNGELIAITAGHNPPEYPLRKFKKALVPFWKEPFPWRKAE